MRRTCEYMTVHHDEVHGIRNKCRKGTSTGCASSPRENAVVSAITHAGFSSTCSTESTISLISSSVTPGIIRSASLKAL